MTGQRGNCKQQWVNFSGCLQFMTTNIIYTTSDNGVHQTLSISEDPKKIQSYAPPEKK